MISNMEKLRRGGRKAIWKNEIKKNKLSKGIEME